MPDEYLTGRDIITDRAEARLVLQDILSAYWNSLSAATAALIDSGRVKVLPPPVPACVEEVAQVAARASQLAVRIHAPAFPLTNWIELTDTERERCRAIARAIHDSGLCRCGIT